MQEIERMQNTKRMTFWLPVDMIEKIKSQATREKRTASVVLREMLGRHLKDR